MMDTMIICGNIDHNEHGTPPLGPVEKRQSLKELGWLESELASARYRNICHAIFIVMFFFLSVFDISIDCWNKVS